MSSHWYRKKSRYQTCNMQWGQGWSVLRQGNADLKLLIRHPTWKSLYGIFVVLPWLIQGKVWLLLGSLFEISSSSRFLILHTSCSGSVLPTGQIYVRGILVEHSYDIFPEYSEKVPYEIPGNIPKKMFREHWILKYSRNVPWIS